jgi:hypothetical protein
VTWHYAKGSWSRTSFLEQGPSTTAGWTADLGYEDWLTVAGKGAVFPLQAMRREKAPEFLIRFGDLSLWDAVTAATLPDALDLLARWSPIVTAALLEEREELEDEQHVPPSWRRDREP